MHTQRIEELKEDEEHVGKIVANGGKIDWGDEDEE